ncbi:hypothetical protein E1180_20165 [Roseibium denhamense]|uniref:Uncharacterized protein n=1 Tax=Roseibium denhamense TaxID=76305 RepID=A0ABY1PD80_9HYPH|nr:hypothetical protein [Roseibium denhamense]MTI07822.1 hypothetical protein [Roseibium denhamense]SMP31899.1 hypothetical protein SAMN06265374_3445 [Roseibium denhamense]
MVVHYIPKHNRQKLLSANVLLISAGLVLIIGAMVGLYQAVSANSREAELDRKAFEAGASTSRLTDLYIADGNRLEKWVLDADTGRRKFAGHTDWSAFTDDGRRQPSDKEAPDGFKWIDKLTNPE